MQRRDFMATTAAIGMAAFSTSIGSGRLASAAVGAGFQTGLRRLHVSADGAGPMDGTSPDEIFISIQAAIDAAHPGDVVTVAPGIYRERPRIRDKSGTGSQPIWIVAERRGQVILSDVWEEAEEGTVTWADDGDGVYVASHASRPYIGEHDGDFLMAYLSKEDLTAPSITAFSAISRDDRTISKPPYGFAYDAEEKLVYLRLRDGVDPNGRSIKLTASFGRPTVKIARSQHVIIDGFVIEGAGNTQAIRCDDDCRHVTVRNCVFQLARHGVRCPSDTLLETCTYRYVGFDRWTRDVFALDGLEDNGVFVLVKGYYHAKAVGEGKRANALLEGSLDFGRNFKTPSTNIVIDRCLIGPAFDGSRIGEFAHSEIRNSVFIECRDDGFQNEGPKKRSSAENNRIHDCRFINCYHDGSHQRHAIGNAFVYRNVVEWNDPDLAVPENFSIKMIGTSPDVSIFYYHNTWVIDYGAGSYGDARLWADFGGPKSNADRIDLFMNNIVVAPGGLSDGPGNNPAVIASNAVVGSSADAAGFLTVNDGVYAGRTAADMGLEADLSLTPASPARHVGKSLPAGLPDSRAGPNAHKDAGAFPFGETPGPDWPRPATLVFNDDLPSRWSSPGA